MIAMGNSDYADSQRQASITLEVRLLSVIKCSEDFHLGCAVFLLFFGESFNSMKNYRCAFIHINELIKNKSTTQSNINDY